MSFDKQLRRSLYALPLALVGLLALGHPPPDVGAVVGEVVSAGLACGSASADAGPMGLARVPGDLGLLARRLNCNS